MSKKLIFLAVFFVLLFIGLQPTLSAKFIPFQQNGHLKTFWSQLLTTRALDPQEFWEIRDQYSPGIMEFNKTGVSKNRIPTSLTLLASKINQQCHPLPFLVFNSLKFESVDFLVGSKCLKNLVIENQQSNYLIKTSSLIAYKDQKDRNSVFLIFLKSESEMETANGFFDYKEIDKALVKNKEWLSISRIVLPN